MCKHTEILEASRNALVVMQDALVQTREVKHEFNRQIAAYDALLEPYFCGTCIAESEREAKGIEPVPYTGFLMFVSEFVEHYQGGTCAACRK